MLKQWLKLFLIIIGISIFANPIVLAATASDQLATPTDQVQAVSEQIELLKNRLQESKNELNNLQHQQEKKLAQLTPERATKEMQKQVGLDIAIAQSNVDSSDIELSEAEQTISRIEKHIQDTENQLNILNIFGLKISRNGAANIETLKADLNDQSQLLSLEKSRADYLQQIKDVANTALQLHQTESHHIDIMLKSQSMVRLKEEQAQSEMNFQREQTYWLQQLNDLYAQLNQAEAKKPTDAAETDKLESEIFFANENVNFTYLQTLIARYQDQIRQFKVSISRSSSIGLFNKVIDQTQLLEKQLARVSDLLKNRVSILEDRKALLEQDKENADKNQASLTGLASMEASYQEALVHVADLNHELAGFRATLDGALQQELSMRQGWPGLGGAAWLDLGEELLWIPTLTFQISKSLIQTTYHAVNALNFSDLITIALLEVIWIFACVLLYRYLTRAVFGMTDHESGHINIKWLGLKLLRRVLIDLAVFVNIVGLLSYCGVPSENYSFIMNLGLVWIFFKVLLTLARLVLIETLRDHEGHDVRLYQRLKWMIGVGGVVTALTIFLHQLPVIYELKDLFVRLFLLYLLIASAFLLRAWYVVPSLLLPYIDDRHKSLKRIVRLLGIFIPMMLFTNSAIGLLGYVNLVLTVSWYESIFLLVLVGYLILRGLLIDLTESLSHVLIRHVTNGWLWTEAVLKPIDRVLRVLLVLVSLAVLFLLYGWDQQSPVVERLNKLLSYHLISALNTTITPISIIEVIVVISLLFWAARWTREFVYRMLLSRTKDLGLRNSIAILSQYATIVVGFFICLGILGIDFRALAFIASAFAFGVGLGLRDLFNNFACGFLLLLERPLRVGDTVTIDHIEGEVIHIGGRAVTIRTDDHNELLVPNAEIFSKNFINWTVRDNVVRGVFSIHVNVTDNPHAIQKLIYDVLASHRDVLKDPAAEVFIKEMKEGSLYFEVRYYLNMRHVKSRQGLKSEILADIWDTFAEHHIKPCYPHREVMVKEAED